MLRKLLPLLIAAASPAFGQDTRTVAEPTFPPACTVLSAQMTIVNNGPAFEMTPDTARIQAALTACASGSAVELAASGSNYAFLSGPLNVPSGVSLIVDGGVTLFASRNREDYQTATVSATVDECGTDGPNGNGCKDFLIFANGSTNAGSGLYGYGVIDGRGYATTLKAGAETGVSWWQNADSYVSSQSQNNPIMMKLAKSTIFTLYKITLRNSPEFHVGWSGTGFTAWGVKIQAPRTAHNTDGIDPVGSNVTIMNPSISDGDDQIAVGASSASSNITIQNVTTYSGHGLSVGSYTQGGLTNMLVQNVNMAGQPGDGNEDGIRLKSAADRGGLLKNLTYNNLCMRDVRRALYLTPIYNSNSGTLIPQFTNIAFNNLHVLAPTGSYANIFSMQDYDASHISIVTLTGVKAGNHTYTALYPGDANYAVLAFGSVTVNVTAASLESTTTKVTATPASPMPYGAPVTFMATVATANGTPTGSVRFLDGSGTTTLATVALAGNSASTTQILGGGDHPVTAVYLGDATYNSSTSAAAAYTVAPVLALLPTTASPTTLIFGGSAVVKANLPPVVGASAPTGTRSILDGGSVVASGSPDATGSFTATITPATPGTHTYFATYSGDANYAATTLSSTAAVVDKANSATTLKITGATTYGSLSILALVTTVSGGPTTTLTPTGNVVLSHTAAAAGGPSAVTIAANGSLQVVVPASAHSVTAAYLGDANFSAATSAPVTFTNTPVAPGLVLVPGNFFIATGGSTTLSATPPSVVVSGTNSLAANVKISVAATVAAQHETPFEQPREVWFATLFALAFFGRKRLRVRCFLAVLFFAGITALSGCGGATTATTTAARLPPTGSQTVTLTAYGSSFPTVTTNVTVTVTS